MGTLCRSEVGIIGINRFGASEPAKAVMERYGFTSGDVAVHLDAMVE
jgi:transketolase